MPAVVKKKMYVSVTKRKITYFFPSNDFLLARLVSSNLAITIHNNNNKKISPSQKPLRVFAIGNYLFPSSKIGDKNYFKRVRPVSNVVLLPF